MTLTDDIHHLFASMAVQLPGLEPVPFHSWIQQTLDHIEVALPPYVVRGLAIPAAQGTRRRKWRGRGGQDRGIYAIGIADAPCGASRGLPERVLLAPLQCR